MEKKLITEINIEDKAINHFASFSLQQAFNSHHYFELRFNHDQMGAPGLINLNDSRDFVGKTLTASFGYSHEQLQHFSGLVTRVELAQSHGYHGVLIVSGYSPTILIDRGEDLGSYLDKDLNDIVKLAVNDTPANDLKIVANASRTASIDYLIQYKESDWEFLNRLSGEYHEWLYYDGQQLNFGKPDVQKDVALFYGRDVHNLQYAMEVSPIKYKRFAYNPKQDEMLQSESSGKADGNPDLAHAIKASNLMYSKTFNQPSLIRVDNGGDIKSHVENEEKAHISELLKVNASGDNCELGIGTIAEITMSIRQELAFATESLGQFLITSITHNLDGTGKYHNTFEGVVADTERILVKNYDKPSPDMQLADVIDNDDPEGQGRIKVKFKWECLTNNVTEWLRVVTPDAGSSEKVSKNRGFAFVPEKGDQVVIAFEEGNIARPIVMGSIFHGKIGSGGGQTNQTKSLTTRSGNTIVMNDHDGSINVKDPSGNVLTMHGNGEVTLTAPNKFTINTTDFIVNASNSIAINAQPGEEGGGEGTIAISAKKTIAATADTEGITIDATTMGVAITGKTDVSLQSTTATASFKGSTEAKIDGANVKMNGTATVRINSSDTDIT
ncbi:type IV secretion protein Rhs [Pedobacter petrophilus]|uniref:Type IV secretion protein Rhs n=1 Tax=Pedobacter petrophilus TaxID=1908241 RepID=A0A7K0G568_9SPHI|nr:phage baseplate assembly protein V [Pedobacter petrophilus]MRX78781.1 type IV secretion protein Rhs [Pedobacter petrophilus]